VCVLGSHRRLISRPPRVVLTSVDHIANDTKDHLFAFIKIATFRSGRIELIDPVSYNVLYIMVSATTFCSIYRYVSMFSKLSRI
jgi:hypothetical protein